MDAVRCGPLSVAQIPLNREKYREFFDSNRLPNRFSPVFMGLLAVFSTNLPNQNREFLRGQQGMILPVTGSLNPTMEFERNFQSIEDPNFGRQYVQH